MPGHYRRTVPVFTKDDERAVSDILWAAHINGQTVATIDCELLEKFWNIYKYKSRLADNANEIALGSAMKVNKYIEKMVEIKKNLEKQKAITDELMERFEKLGQGLDDPKQEEEKC